MKNQKNKPESSVGSNPETNTGNNFGITASKPSKSERNANIKFILTITLKLLLISAVTALMLAVVNALTIDKIAENNAAEKSEAIKSLFPSADENQSIGSNADGVDNIWLVFSGGDLLGYAAGVSPFGFGGKMDVMVGVNSDGTLAGIEIVSHSETPGIGNRVDDESFLSQFKGRSGQISPGGVDVITGSTISSKAVIGSINKALAAYGTIFMENDVVSDGGAK